MIKYFKELLSTLKRIDSNLEKCQKSLAKIDGCVKTSGRGYGDNQSLSVKHWNNN